MPKLYLIWARRARLQLINSSAPQEQERFAGINSRNRYNYRSEGRRSKYAIVTLETQEIKHQRSQSANLNNFRNYICSDIQFSIVSRESFPKALFWDRSALSLHQAGARGAGNAQTAPEHFHTPAFCDCHSRTHWEPQKPEMLLLTASQREQHAVKFAHQALGTRAGSILTASLQEEMLFLCSP